MNPTTPKKITNDKQGGPHHTKTLKKFQSSNQDEEKMNA